MMPKLLTKAHLRTHFIAARNAVPADEALLAAQQLARHLLPLIPPGATVAGYRATSGEIVPDQALIQLHARGHTLCLPVTQAQDKHLIFRRWQPGDRLQRGKFNIEIPQDSAEELTPDVLLVPLVAFDAQGNRLGYGAGYYDRTIAQLRESKKPCKLIGIAFAMQGVESLPAEAHDEKLAAIATEQGVIYIS